MEFSIREVGVILDGDPRKARAFDIEKYATYAGLSKDYIQKGGSLSAIKAKYEVSSKHEELLTTL